MQEEKLTDKIPHNSKIAIYGAGSVGKEIQKYINNNRPDIKIVCYIDTSLEGEFEGLKVYNLREIKNIKNKFDLILMSVRTKNHELVELFAFFDIPFILISAETEKYFRIKKYIGEMHKVLEIFERKEDKELYSMICDLWLAKNPDKLREYVKNTSGISIYGPIRNYHKQYFEHINHNAIETVFDGGVCNAIQFFNYKKYFKNLKAIYGFDPMYETFKNEAYDYLIKEEIPQAQIVYRGLWNKEEELTFVETPDNRAGSYVQNSSANRTTKNTDIILKIKTTSIDLFKKQNNIKKVDFIKMDIEGSEQNALKGAQDTILSDRVQLAISIYHSIDDLTKIPVYLFNLLKDKDYAFRLGHYSPKVHETVFYAIPKELLGGGKNA